MNTKHEQYIFFQECITSLNAAWSIIDALVNSENHKVVVWAAYRMAFIEYAKPYKSSWGIEVKRHTLELPDISPGDRALHDRIISLRDTVLAHSDISVKDAQLFLEHIDAKSLPLIVSNTPNVLPTLTEFRGLIENSLDQLYRQLSEIEEGITCINK